MKQGIFLLLLAKSVRTTQKGIGPMFLANYFKRFKAMRLVAMLSSML